MTAEEKAKEIIEKFTDFGKEYTYWPKQCAITCVEEIIATIENISFDYSIGLTTEHKWWNKVKDELIKL